MDQETLLISAYTFHLAVQSNNCGNKLDSAGLKTLEAQVQELRKKPGHQLDDLGLNDKVDEPFVENLWEEIPVKITPWGVRRIIEPLTPLVEQRLDTIKSIILSAIQGSEDNVKRVVSILAEWMHEHTIVHVIGAGRALLAASIPANRLAHGGANVYLLGDKSPPPNSRFGGGIIAASASGKTPAVLEIMRFAKALNEKLAASAESSKEGWPGIREIKIVGIADKDAKEFESLCTPGYFLGIEKGKSVHLRGLGDIEEYAISELLDSLVVAAGTEIGVNFYLGHEDLVGGATGPWHQHS